MLRVDESTAPADSYEAIFTALAHPARRRILTSLNFAEGEMTALKSEVVSRRAFARIGQRLDLMPFIRVDVASLRTFNERSRDSLCADVLEAIVGARPGTSLVGEDRPVGHRRPGRGLREESNLTFQHPGQERKARESNPDLRPARPASCPLDEQPVE